MLRLFLARHEVTLPVGWTFAIKVVDIAVRICADKNQKLKALCSGVTQYLTDELEKGKKPPEDH